MFPVIPTFTASPGIHCYKHLPNAHGKTLSHKIFTTNYRKVGFLSTISGNSNARLKVFLNGIFTCLMLKSELAQMSTFLMKKT